MVIKTLEGVEGVNAARKQTNKSCLGYEAACKIKNVGASSRDRTGDLILTMDALYLLSYRGIFICGLKYIINL